MKLFHFLKLYGFRGTCQLVIYKLYTLIFIPSAKLIRLPIDLRNKSHIEFGTNLTCGKYCRFEVHPDLQTGKKKLLVFGNNVQVNDFVHIVAIKGVTIGNNVLIASKVFISDSNHGCYSGANQSDPEQPPVDRTLSANPISISDNVWIGEFVSILQGVTIGRGCIIGSMSVVTKSIPDYCIATGSPARVIKQFDFLTKKWEKV